jgi:hypothetical protein
MGMAIYLFYLLLEVVNLETNLNFMKVNSERNLTLWTDFNRVEVFNHLRRDKKLARSWLETGRAEPWPAWQPNKRRGEVGVQAHVLVLLRDLEQREDDQDEDEANLMNSDL